MGMWRNVACTRCDHVVMHISAGFDAGMEFETMTLRCGRCRDLVDVCYQQGWRWHMSEPTGDPPKWEYPTALIHAFPELACPCCGGHDLSFWDWRHGCPKCGGRMELMDDGDYILFD